MSAQDTRWAQRFDNFRRAFARLDDAVKLAGERPLTPLEEQGLVQAFEFTHELAWNTLKDFLQSQGAQGLYGSKDTTRAAFQAGLIEDGEAWMKMIADRDLTSHTYNEAIARGIVANVRKIYGDAFAAFKDRFEALKQERLT